MTVPDFLLSLIIIYVAARVMGEAAMRVGQSAVLGELLAGVVIGGSLLGLVTETPVLKLLGEVGVMLLLFEVGLESDLQSFLRVGTSALFVALIGVAAPFLLGYAVAAAAGLAPLQAIFVGATLTATSVAISARVLADFGKLDTLEGRIIVGAAVVDDILGLIVLAIMVELAEAGTVHWRTIASTGGLAILFLTLSVIIGIRFGPVFSRLLNVMSTRGAATVAALTFALSLGYVSELLHLAPIVGAFAAGLILTKSEHQHHIHERIRPVSDVFVPIFFVLVGAAVDLHHLNPFVPANHPILLLTAGLFVVAVLGKLAAGWGVIGRPAKRWIVGIGMVPRGEVGLIFAGVGLTAGLVADEQYAALVSMVALTTLLAPMLLKTAIRRAGR